MQPFPHPSQFVVRVLLFPLAKTSAVRSFATDWRTGLGVVTEFVVEHVIEEDPRNPRLGEPRIHDDRWPRLGAVTSEADGRQPSPWAVASPVDDGAG